MLVYEYNRHAQGADHIGDRIIWQMNEARFVDSIFGIYLGDECGEDCF